MQIETFEQWGRPWRERLQVGLRLRKAHFRSRTVANGAERGRKRRGLKLTEGTKVVEKS